MRRLILIAALLVLPRLAHAAVEVREEDTTPVMPRASIATEGIGPHGVMERGEVDPDVEQLQIELQEIEAEIADNAMVSQSLESKNRRLKLVQKQVERQIAEMQEAS